MAKIVKAATEAATDVDTLPTFEQDVVGQDAVEQSAQVQVNHFEDLPQTNEPHYAVEAEALRQYENDHRYVQVKTRIHLPRTRICGQWYSFTAGKVTTVPKYVRDWLDQQGVL